MLRTCVSSNLLRTDSKVDVSQHDVEQKRTENRKSIIFNTYEELGPSLAEALRYKELSTPLKMQTLNSTESTENLERSIESQSQSQSQTSASTQRDIAVGVTRSIVIGRILQSSVDILSIVEEFFTQLNAQLKLNVTGFCYLQESTFLVYLETPPDTFARVCRSLSQLPVCFPRVAKYLDYESMRILGSCDDNPLRLLEEMNYRKGASTRTHKRDDSTTSSDQDNRHYMQIAEAFINVVKFIRWMSNFSKVRTVFRIH